MNDKALRQNIMAIAVKKYGWNYDEFHELLEEWGYGNSLRALPRQNLQELRIRLVTLADQSNYCDFDKQGLYMWSLAKQAWPQRTRKRLQLFWIKRYHKTHWNILTEEERRGTINMLKGYQNG